MTVDTQNTTSTRNAGNGARIAWHPHNPAMDPENMVCAPALTVGIARTLVPIIRAFQKLPGLLGGSIDDARVAVVRVGGNRLVSMAADYPSAPDIMMTLQELLGLDAQILTKRSDTSSRTVLSFVLDCAVEGETRAGVSTGTSSHNIAMTLHSVLNTVMPLTYGVAPVCKWVFRHTYGGLIVNPIDGGVYVFVSVQEAGAGGETQACVVPSLKQLCGWKPHLFPLSTDTVSFPEEEYRHSTFDSLCGKTCPAFQVL